MIHIYVQKYLKIVLYCLLKKRRPEEYTPRVLAYTLEIQIFNLRLTKLKQINVAQFCKVEVSAQIKVEKF